MWLQQTSAGLKGATAATATVTNTGGGYVNASGESDHLFLPLFLPTGICALPKEGDEALLLPLDGGAVCIATLCPPKAAAGLLNGELRLYSQGGAEITLKNNGDVVINGLTIKPNGTFKESVVTTP
ncbi:MAG: hypothetical protein RSB36_03990 [Hydrogenoanaerobacterium sp.]